MQTLEHPLKKRTYIASKPIAEIKQNHEKVHLIQKKMEKKIRS